MSRQVTNTGQNIIISRPLVIEEGAKFIVVYLLCNVSLELLNNALYS